MTQEIFEAILKDSRITWNDIVEITIINPYYKRSWFKAKSSPKTIVFEGALGYHKGDKFVNLCIDADDRVGTRELYFEFKDILGINKIN